MTKFVHACNLPEPLFTMNRRRANRITCNEFDITVNAVLFTLPPQCNLNGIVTGKECVVRCIEYSMIPTNHIMLTSKST